MKLETLLSDYLEHLNSLSNKSKETINAYKYDVTSFVNYFNDISFSEQKIKEYFESLIAKGYKTSSIKRKRISISLFLAYLKKQKKIKNNPMNDITFDMKEERKIPRTIPIPTIKKILNYLKLETVNSKTDYEAFKSSRDLALFDLLITTGIRIGEASNIIYNDIDFNNRTILIHGKGKKERIVYIPNNDCWVNIQNYSKIRSEICCQNNYFFINKFHQKLGTHSIDALFREIVDKLKISTTITPHCLRHTFATNLLSSGGDIRTVQELMGHSSITTTEIYTHVDLRRKKQVLDKYNFRNKI